MTIGRKCGILKPVRKLLPLFLALPIFLLAGCSSQFKLLVHNDSAGPLDIHIEIQMPPGERSIKNDHRLEAGEVCDAAGWFGVPPQRVLAVARGRQGTVKRVFELADYPPTMRRGSSMGLPVHLHVRPSGITLTGPTFLEANQTTLLFCSFCCGVPLALFGVVYLIFRAALRRRP